MLVRLIYPEKWDITFRQIPGNHPENLIENEAKIGSVTFTTDEVEEADLAIIINFTPKSLRMRAREAWIFHHEPGNAKFFRHWQKAYPYADRVFGSWSRAVLPEKYASNFTQAQASIFWQCPKTYDYYKALTKPEKTTLISAITSSKKGMPGHRERLDFLYELKKEFEGTKYDFEIKGRGISDFKSKDDILIPSKYTLAIENTSEPHYFSEKLTDAFLCNTMPIYFGAPNIFEYFPKNSLVMLEDLDVKKAKEIIKYTVENNLYEKNLNEIMSAKNMVLNKYNLFMNIIEKIAEYDVINKPMKDIRIPKRHQKRHPILSKIKNKIKSRI